MIECALSSYDMTCTAAPSMYVEINTKYEWSGITNRKGSRITLNYGHASRSNSPEDSERR